MSDPRPWAPKVMTPAMYRAIAATAIHGSRKEAAAVLGVREQTVKNSCSNAYAVFGVHSVTEVCIALGWLVIPAVWKVDWE